MALVAAVLVLAGGAQGEMAFPSCWVLKWAMLCHYHESLSGAGTAPNEQLALWPPPSLKDLKAMSEEGAENGLVKPEVSLKRVGVQSVLAFLSLSPKPEGANQRGLMAKLSLW